MIEQNTPEWLEMRKSKIGASDAPIIMGESPYGTPLQLYEEKIGIRERYQHGGMALGHKREPIARRLFEEEMLCAVEPTVVVHPVHEWMMASLDGYDQASNLAVEIKNPNEQDHETARQGKVPQKYFAQLQHQMEILFALNGVKSIHYFSHRHGDTVNLLVERDEKYIQKMLEKERDFFNCLTSRTPPESQSNDYLPIEGSMEHVAKELAVLLPQISSLKSREKELRQQLIELAQGQNYQGCGIRMTKSKRKGTVDYKSIPQLEGVDLEQYRSKPQETYTIIIKNA